MNIYDEYFNGWPDNLKLFDDFDKKFGFRFLQKLKKTSNKVSFLATVTEIQCGLFFSQSCDDLKYDAPIFKGSELTPDWTVIKDGQSIIAEVVRLNASKDDQTVMNEEGLVMDALMEIKHPYVVRVSVDVELMDWDAFNVDALRAEAETWFKSLPVMEDERTFNEHIVIEILGQDDSYAHVMTVSGVRRIQFKTHRFNGDNGKLLQKLNKYVADISQAGVPFIICPYIHFESWVKLEDVYQTLYGHSVDFEGEYLFGEYGEFIPGAVYHDLDGLYYKHEDAKSHLSGVLVRNNDSYTYFHNYSSTNRLSESNKRLFMPYHYREK